MEKKLIGIIIGIFIIIGSLVFLFLSSNDKELGVSPSNQLEDCNSIYFNGDDKVNLVFFSTSDEAKIYSDSLFEVEPLKKEDFNVYNIEYFPGCSLYEDIALFCYTPGLIEKSSSCPNDFVIVLDEKDRIIRSSSYMNVISINTRHQESVFAHEFGHAFANLAEEYVPAKLPRKSRNCVQSCENFEISDGCFEGCSKDSYFRSIELGIMRTLKAERFGVFNEKIIDELIFNKNPGITGGVISEGINCEDERYYSVSGYYDNVDNSISINRKKVVNGCLGGNGNGNFEYKLYNRDGEESFGGSFNPEILFTDMPDESGDLSGEVFEVSGDFILKIPSGNFDRMEILHNDEISVIRINDIGGRACRII